MNQRESPSYVHLFRSFFWMGLTAFGGLAMFAVVREYSIDTQSGCHLDHFRRCWDLHPVTLALKS
jgi:chromate transport protein ChrA